MGLATMSLVVTIIVVAPLSVLRVRGKQVENGVPQLRVELLDLKTVDFDNGDYGKSAWYPKKMAVIQGHGVIEADSEPLGDNYYQLSCEAPYLTRWTSTMSIFPKRSPDKFGYIPGAINTFKYTQDLRRFQKLGSGDPRSGNYSKTLPGSLKSFKIQMLLLVLPELSGMVTCQGIHNSSLKSQVYFYAGGPRIFSRPTVTTDLTSDRIGHVQYFLPGSLQEIVIPCSLNKEAGNIKLFWSMNRWAFQDSPMNLVTESMAKFDHQIGFTVNISQIPNNTHEMNWKCVQGNETAVTDSIGLYTFRALDKCRKCKGPRAPLTSHESFHPRPIISFQNVLKMSIFPDTSKWTHSENHVVNYKGGNIAQDFYIIDVTRPALECNSTRHNQILVSILCNFPYECDLYKPYTALRTADLDKVDVTWTQTTRNGGQLGYSGSTTVSRGLLACTNPERDFRTIDYFFTGLDKWPYLISQAVPTRALLHLDEVLAVLYTNDTVQFTCDASAFLLISKTIRFSLFFANGTSHILPDIDVGGNYKNFEDDFVNGTQPPDPNDHCDDEPDPFLLEFQELGFHRRTIRLQGLSVDVTGIGCSSPWFNSTDWLHISRSFSVKVRTPPRIQKERLKGPLVFSKSKEFYIECPVLGNPPPEIHWLDPNQNKMDARLYSVGSHEESILKFPTNKPIQPGKYTCVASNIHGTDSFTFSVQQETLGAGPIVGILIAILVFIALGVLIFILGRKYLRARNELRNLTEKEYNEFINGDPTAKDKDGNIEDAQLVSIKSYEINEEDLIIARDAVLGEGEFGKVFRGFLVGAAVAVKTTKSTVEVKYFQEFLKELKIMAYVGPHEHVVHFRGAVINRVRERIVYCVVELSPHGNLHSYLRKNWAASGKFGQSYTNFEIQESGPINLAKLVDWSQQIAHGMAHLSTKKVIHGDLATRNVLVFSNDQVKISDFGLSKQLYGYAKYTKKQKMPLPWTHMALESLKFMEFSTQSDVWAYGITVFEIFSGAQFPYPGLSWTIDFNEELEKGLRVKKPPLAPQFIYDVILWCCQNSPGNRPTFRKLVETIESFREGNTNVGNFPTKTEMLMYQNVQGSLTSPRNENDGHVV